MPARSKIVSRRRRCTPLKDDEIIRKMRAFRPPSVAPTLSSSVGCSLSSPHTALLPKPANDNQIAVWELVGDTVKVVAATVALQLAEQPAIAFAFNLTPEAIAEALTHPTGFLDRIKRSFDKELQRAGIDLANWLTIDRDDDDRLHIQGAFVCLNRNVSLELMPRIRKAMKVSWGEWSGAGKRKQLRFKRLYSDGWATYCMRHRHKVAKLIGSRRTFTINHVLRRDAQSSYTFIRRTMRGDMPSALDLAV